VGQVSDLPLLRQAFNPSTIDRTNSRHQLLDPLATIAGKRAGPVTK
jgi:hypothetical protein